jgi:hypothetical protein
LQFDKAKFPKKLKTEGPSDKARIAIREMLRAIAEIKQLQKELNIDNLKADKAPP